MANANGTLQASIPYTVAAYSADDQQMHNSQYTQYVTIKLKVE